MKTFIYKLALLAIIIFSFTSCEDFLELETPDHKIVSETVFNNEETAISAMTGIYNQLYRTSFSGGRENSVHVLAGLSADELQVIRENDLSFLEFQQNEIQPNNNRNLSLWSGSYTMIYMTNSLLEGLESSNELSDEIRKSLEGEAKFIRALTYFYLVNLYGEVPLILTTDYNENSLASRKDKDLIYEQIINDLNESIALLSPEYREDDRSRVNRFAAVALLARVHLYLENWEMAQELSSEVIAQSNSYQILEDLNQVFLANSQEAIWQISPIGGGGRLTYTNEGLTFIIDPFVPFFTQLRLHRNLVSSFEEEDKRLTDWIGYFEGSDSYFAYKYKDGNSIDNITEYSMVLRLSEQFLIRAEAKLNQGDLPGAIADLDIIRKRAGLDLISEMNPEISEEDLMNQILIERRKELFTEWGHRWLDLTRTNMATNILSDIKPNWQDTDVLYPIPAEERSKNPNLSQNSGY
ncbi:RagB/SusD family nutrient uptake outer membrane protein [Salegentibacter sp. LM13S]|uniref:RagB/SusD family nutrient uptake outer membrane protein n=1 Tax=Salegentibacter lacus TaxID=2873599 RepID=UPI001CCADC0B|nr:RagB/SusD family nutrient uptake outer membrane protein [Salegentibacter lacus]MBZ9629796.1 RagB/SusD family nutrient uptake outer membrane protein [Salegentibacter lacus]